jgi:hypothetical protein
MPCGDVEGNAYTEVACDRLDSLKRNAHPLSDLNDSWKSKLTASIVRLNGPIPMKCEESGERADERELANGF